MYATGIKMWDMMAFSEYRTGYFSERTLLEQTAFYQREEYAKFCTQIKQILFFRRQNNLSKQFLFSEHRIKTSHHSPKICILSHLKPIKHLKIFQSRQVCSKVPDIWVILDKIQ